MARAVRRDDDSGFTLLEVVVAMTVFTVLATVTLGLVVRTGQVAASNIRRTTAANVAVAQIEQLRGTDVFAIPNGVTTSSTTVNNITYAIRQTASFVPSSGATSTCADTSNSLAYKRVTVQVTWPGMGSVKPVRADTLKAVGVGAQGLDANDGSLAISVRDSAGNGVPDIAVTLPSAAATQVTGDDGCVIFTGLNPGTYTATVASAGYVGVKNTRAVTGGGYGVLANTVSRGTITYDTDRSTVLALDSPAAAVLPTGLKAQYSSTYVTTPATLAACTSPVAACISGVPGTISNLFPETYTIKVGTCAEAAGSSSSTSVALAAAADDGATATVPVGVLKVDVQNLVGGASLTGKAVTFTHAAQPTTTGGCATGETLTGTTTTAGGTSFVLPYGTWVVSVGSSGPLSPSQLLSSSVTMSPSAKSQTLVLKTLP